MENIIFVVEGESDATIIRTLIEVPEHTRVHFSIAHGKLNIPSISRTLQLMYQSKDTYIVVVFDADTEDEIKANEELQNMRYLTKADISQMKIGVFCFRPSLDILFPKGMKYKGLGKETIDYIHENINKMKEDETIRQIQSFLNELAGTVIQ